MLGAVWACIIGSRVAAFRRDTISMYPKAGLCEVTPYQTPILLWMWIVHDDTVTVVTIINIILHMILYLRFVSKQGLYIFIIISI